MATVDFKTSSFDFVIENFKDWALNPKAAYINGPSVTISGCSKAMNIQALTIGYSLTKKIHFYVMYSQSANFKTELCLCVGKKEVYLERSKIAPASYIEHGPPWFLPSEDLLQTPEKFLDKGRARIRVYYIGDPNSLQDDKEVCQLAKDFGTAFLSPKFSDVLLVCDSSEIHAHKVILASRSKYFEAMFSHQETRESLTNRVDIEDISTEALKSMVKFIYTNSVADDEITTDLLTAADKYDIGPLFQRCVDNLSEKVLPETAVSYFLSAHLHGAEELKQKCLKLIIDNYKTLKEKKELDDVVKNYPEVMMEILDFSCATVEELKKSKA